MFSKILVPLDGSEFGEKALDTAQSLAKSLKSTIHLIEVVSRRPELEARRQGGATFLTGALELELDQARQLIDSQLGRAKEYLETKATQLQEAGIDIVTAIGEGAADEKIIEYARENDIDLIVMGIHGHGGIRRFLLGSVTDRVVRSGEKSVLVVPAS